ncbi:MAG: TonB-dependent receptor [Gammaproteobacteria bacterium]
MSFSHSKLVHLAVGAAIGAAGFAGPTWAQDTTLALEEVVVTARKVEESIQDAPISVTAFTDAAIAERGITDLSSLAEFSPGLSFSQAFGRQNDRPVIRGQGNVLANVQFGVESGTAYFIDGVYYNGDIQALDFDMLQRIEVVKGPQSALYGRNTYAGAINFVTRDPRGDKWGGTVRASGGKFGDRRASINVDGPIAEGILTARFGARINKYDGEYTNQATGKLVGDEQDRSFNATFLLTPTENLTMRAFVQYRHQDDGPLALFLQGANFNNCKPGYRSIGYRGLNATTGAVATSAASGQFAPVNNVNQYYCGVIQARPELIWLNTDAIGTTAKFPNNTFRDGTAFDGVEAAETFSSFSVEWAMPNGATVRSLSGYRAIHDLFGTDSDHSEAFTSLGPTVEPLFANTNRNDRREWSTELKMSSPADARFRYTVGAYYYNIDDKEKDLTYASPYFGVINANANVTGIENRASFASLSYDFSEKLSASLEVRRFTETKRRREFNAAGASSLYVEGAYKDTTPRFTVDYRWSDDVLLYGIVAKGVRPGGINGSAGASIGRPTYDQETSNNLELGIKSTLMDGRVRFNAAAYFIDSKDVQVTQALPAASGGTAVTSIAVNQAKAETTGLEVEVTAALTQYLTSTVAFAYSNAEFKKGCDDFEYVLNSGGFAYKPAYFGSALCNIAGRRLPLAPETQGNVVLTYERPMSDSLSFVASGTFTHEGSKFVQVHNLAETGDTNMLGLRLGVKSDDWSITAYGRNLTDEDTIPLATRWFDLRYGSGPRGLAGIAPVAPAGDTVTPTYDSGSPRALFAALRKGRTFGLEVSYSF